MQERKQLAKVKTTDGETKILNLDNPTERSFLTQQKSSIFSVIPNFKPLSSTNEPQEATYVTGESVKDDGSVSPRR